MARKIIRRFVPSPAAIKDKPGLRFLGGLLQNSSLFHLNRQSVSMAFFVGIFVAFLPMPFQMPLAALLALWVRCNLPLAVALVWITNPLTMPVIFFVTYQFGRWLLQTPPMTVSLELSWDWLINEFGLIWKPLLVGSVLSGLFSPHSALSPFRYFGAGKWLKAGSYASSAVASARQKLARTTSKRTTFTRMCKRNSPPGTSVTRNAEPRQAEPGWLAMQDTSWRTDKSPALSPPPE